MSTVDAAIPLSGNTQGLDVGKLLEVTSTAQQMRQRQTEFQSKNALTQLLASPQSYDQQGNLTPTALRSSNAFSPEYALEYRKQQIDSHFKKVQEDSLGDEQKKRKLEFYAGIADATEKARDDALKAGASEQDAISAATKARNELLDSSGGMLGIEDIHNGKSMPYDPVFMGSLKRFKPGEIQEERLAEQDKLGQERIALQSRQEGERERADRAREERIIAAVGSRGGKPPAGYEWDPEHPDTLRTIKGGPKDPDAIKPWAGREKVYTERILGSANQAATAIQNITELPVGASTGLLGIGGHSGGSLFGASFGALKNKMTDQEVQDYNVMLAGVKRNLAAIETAGLAPQGALTESMGSLELRPGDSNTTKLRKLAEMRQIVEKGMDVPLADPAIPPQIKSLATKVVDTVTKAVPYTQADVTKLQRAGEKNPDMTLEQLMQSQGLGAGQSSRSSGNAPATATRGDYSPRATASGAVKAVSSKSQYDALPSGARYSKPGDPPGSYRTKQ